MKILLLAVTFSLCAFADEASEAALRAQLAQAQAALSAASARSAPATQTSVDSAISLAAQAKGAADTVAKEPTDHMATYATMLLSTVGFLGLLCTQLYNGWVAQRDHNWTVQAATEARTLAAAASAKLDAHHVVELAQLAQTQQTLATVEKHTNSLTDQLVKSTSDASYAQGMKDATPPSKTS